MKRFLLIFLLIGIGQVCLGQRTCKLNGVVLLYDLDMKKEPLPYITVELLHVSTTTDSKGEFKLVRDCSVKDVNAVPSNFSPAEKGRYVIFDPARLYYTVSEEKPFEVLMCDAKKREKIIRKYFNLIDVKYKKKYEEAKQKLDETSKDYEEKIHYLQSQFRDRSKIQEQAEKFFLIDKTTCDSIMLQAKELLDSGMVEEAFSILQKAPNLEGLEQLVQSAWDIFHHNIQRYDMLIVTNDLRDRPDKNLRNQYYDSLIYYYRYGVKTFNVNESFKTNFAATLYRYAKTTYWDVPGEKGFPLLKESADLGNAVAQYDLGRYYESEKYYQKDSMLYWYQRSAKQGYEDAVVRMNRYPDFYAINKHGDTIYYSINADSISVSITYLDDQHPYNYQEVNIPKTVVPDAIFDTCHYFFAKASKQQKIKYKVTRVGYNAFGLCRILERITLPKSIIEVEDEAFNGCENLVSVLGLDYVSRIGDLAFYRCKLLTLICARSAIYIGNAAFAHCEKLNQFVFPNSLVSIGESAFSNCSKLGSINIPDGIIAINDWTFHGCSNLEDVFLPNSLDSIGVNAFSDCSKLESINIPDDVKKIGYGAFFGCKNLTYMYLPDSLTVLEKEVFCNCKGLKRVVLPKYLERVGRNAFDGCSNLDSIDIPEMVKSIGSEAFRLCRNLNNIEIPNSVLTIGHRAFLGCDNLNLIILPESIDAIGLDVFPKNSHLFVLTPNNHFRIVHGDYGDSIICFDDEVVWINPSMDTLIVPDKIVSISSWLCSWNKNIKKIVLPSTLESIGDYAFKSCSKLQEVVLPDSLKLIGKSAFSGCVSLSSINIPNSVDSIGDAAFQSCSKLQEVVLSDSLRSIGHSVFSRCSSLKSIIIPNSVVSIGDFAFESCYLLREVFLSDSLKVIGSSAFRNCNHMESIIIPKGVVKIGSESFRKCDRLTSISIPNSVEQIGSTVFPSNRNLKIETTNKHIRIINGVICFDNRTIWSRPYILNVVLPDAIDSIDRCTFEGCRNLRSIVIPNSVKYIGLRAFADCKSLENVVLPDSLESLGTGAFSGCSNLQSIVIPRNTIKLGGLVFENCKKLTSIHMPNTIESIEDRSFAGCSNLESIKLPNNVTGIKERVFENCTSLKEVVLPESLKLIGKSAFNGCNALESIIIPKGSLTHFKKILDESYHHLLVEK